MENLPNSSIAKHLKLAEVAKRLGVHVATIRRVALRKGVRIVKIGGAHRMREDDVSRLAD